MLAARYRGIIAGVVLGSVSALLTYHIRSLITLDSNPVMSVIRRAAFALVVPGELAALLTGVIYVSRLWAVAAVNFLFWFGFGWLFETFISEFIKLRRAIAAVR